MQCKNKNEREGEKASERHGDPIRQAAHRAKKKKKRKISFM